MAWASHILLTRNLTFMLIQMLRFSPTKLDNRSNSVVLSYELYCRRDRLKSLGRSHNRTKNNNLYVSVIIAMAWEATKKPFRTLFIINDLNCCCGIKWKMKLMRLANSFPSAHGDIVGFSILYLGFQCFVVSFISAAPTNLLHNRLIILLNSPTREFIWLTWKQGCVIQWKIQVRSKSAKYHTHD